MAKTTINWPEPLGRTLAARAKATGTDVTGIVVQAVNEYLAGPQIGLATLANVMTSFIGGVTCAACSAEGVEQFTVLMDEPLVTVCAPYCASNGAPVDAHGYTLAREDRVILCLTDSGALIATIVALSTDPNGEPVAMVQIPGVDRTYYQRCRMLQRVDSTFGAQLGAPVFSG